LLAWGRFLPEGEIPHPVAQPLAALHHALSYYAAILPCLEVRWEMELMLPFYLKMALRLAT